MNIAEKVRAQSKKRPEKCALKIAKKKIFQKKYDYKEISFKDFERQSDEIARGLELAGLKRSDKVLVFLKPGREFALATFALFKMGAIPVFIDPGMGKKNLLAAVKEVSPKGLIGLPIVHLISLLYLKSFDSLEVKVTTGRFKLPGKNYKTLNTVQKLGKKELNQRPYPLAEMEEEETGAILFTSGGTGVPKGVLYTHSIFIHQTQALQKMFSLQSKDVDLPAFPLFSFFTMAMGMTSCPPDMNPSKPAQCDPERLIQNIKDIQATFVAGSPAIWERVADYALKNKTELESIKKLVMFGAPVSLHLHEKLLKILPNGETFTPYGATESLPVSLANGSFLLSSTADKTLEGHGTCIGKAAPNVEIKIIPTSDEVIESLEQTSFLANNRIGEIIVKGPTTSMAYFNRQKETKKSKIYDSQDFWHRMGDLGYLDDDELLWFCGRKAHHLKIKSNQSQQDKNLYSVCEEVFFNQIPYVKRSALIEIEKNKKAGMVLELKKTAHDVVKEDLIASIEEVLKKHPNRNYISEVYLSKNFPVDVRHNIKIDRPKLSKLAKNGKLTRVY